jgi:hypothetical protein
MQDDVGVRRGDCLLYSPVLSQSRRQSDGPFARCSKRRSKPMFTRLPVSSYDMPTTKAWDMATITKMGTMIAMGMLELRVPKQNMSIELAPPRANKARDKAT